MLNEFATDTARSQRASHSTGHKLIAHVRGDGERASAEQFICEAFFRTHQACIQTFLPLLLSLKDASGALCAVVGCRFAEDDDLFLERYLTAPIDSILTEHAGRCVRRSAVVEVGNLACRDMRTAQCLIGMLPRYLIARGRSWVVFTATSSLRSILRATGAQPLELAIANPGRIIDGADKWGSYYENDPRVMAGYLPHARRLPALWNAASED